MSISLPNSVRRSKDIGLLLSLDVNEPIKFFFFFCFLNLLFSSLCHFLLLFSLSFFRALYSHLAHFSNPSKKKKQAKKENRNRIFPKEKVPHKKGRERERNSIFNSQSSQISIGFCDVSHNPCSALSKCYVFCLCSFESSVWD